MTKAKLNTICYYGQKKNIDIETALNWQFICRDLYRKTCASISIFEHSINCSDFQQLFFFQSMFVYFHNFCMGSVRFGNDSHVIGLIL